MILPVDASMTIADLAVREGSAAAPQTVLGKISVSIASVMSAVFFIVTSPV